MRIAQYSGRLVGVLVAGSILMGSASYPAHSAIGQDLEGTAWVGDGDNGIPFVLELKPNGKLKYMDDRSEIWSGTWTSLGSSIEIRVKEEPVTLYGSVEGNRMSGRATTGNRENWQWSAVQQPVVVLPVVPEYAILEAVARISGNVMIDLAIDPSGRVREVQPITGHPLLKRLAETAARRWEFSETDQGSLRKARLFFSFRLLDKLDSQIIKSVFLSPYRIEIRHGIPSIDTAVGSRQLPASSVSKAHSRAADGQNKKDNSLYQIQHVFPPGKKNRFTTALVTLNASHFNRTDMKSLGCRLNKQFPKVTRLKAGLLDDESIARLFLSGALERTALNKAQRGLYYSDQAKHVEYIQFSTKRGRPRNEVTIRLKCD